MITSMQSTPMSQNFKARHPRAPRGSRELRVRALAQDINSGTISLSAAKEKVADLMGEVDARGRKALRAFREEFLGNQLC